VNDLFGRPVISRLTGEQLPLFHEPVEIRTLQTVLEKRLARQYPVEETPSMFKSDFTKDRK
jgi:hypothetical protein